MSAVYGCCCVLPGDFAMLLNAGMSAKQALVYNCVSSVLCMIGMVFGVAVGNMSSATSWIFAVIAGLFLYVALVDMVPCTSCFNSVDSSVNFLHGLMSFKR